MKREVQTSSPGTDNGGVRPWHVLLIGTLAAGAASLYATRASGSINMAFVTVTVLTVGLVAAAAYRSLAPLVSADAGEQTEILGGRTRAAIEREKMLVLRSIKEIEFDHAMRKISDRDFQEMVTRLRGRAVGLMRQLEGAGAYRALIERDVAKLIGSVPAPESAGAPAAAAAGRGACAACATVNDADARFCKSCGASLGGRS